MITRADIRVALEIAVAISVAVLATGAAALMIWAVFELLSKEVLR